MNTWNDWKFCLAAAVGTMALMIFTGDISGLIFFPLWYYLALKNFDKEVGNETT